MNDLVTLDGISYSVPAEKKSSPKTILRKVTFSIQRGKITGLTGESGCGKTTVAKIISGLYKPTEGEVKFNFTQTTGSVQMLFQNSAELINPLRKVGDILKDAARDSNEIESLAGRTGLPEMLMESFGYQLSGGERQRAALCRILLAGPELLILDEPFSAQDAESKQNFSMLLKDLNKNYGLTILCISHETDKLIQLTDELIIMYGGAVAECGRTAAVAGTPFHPYTKFLMDSSDYKLKREEFINETDTVEPDGCVYYGRCARRGDNCKYEVDVINREGRRSNCNFPPERK